VARARQEVVAVAVAVAEEHFFERARQRCVRRRNGVEGCGRFSNLFLDFFLSLNEALNCMLGPDCSN
jgi:hypothetical protein